MDELETLASTFSDQPELEADNATVAKRQSLFGYSASEAAKQLQEHRASILPVVSNRHWELVRGHGNPLPSSLSASNNGVHTDLLPGACREGGQRIRQGGIRTLVPSPIPVKGANNTSAFQKRGQLPPQDGMLETIRTFGRIVLKMVEIPGTDVEGNHTKFCIVNLSAKAHIEGWLAGKGNPFQPNFVPCSRADKSLSSISLAPTLGVDATLPHLRIDSTATEPQPTQSQYPVWYFFYGTLGDPDVLRRLLGVDPIYRPASVTGGRLIEWGETYKALIDSPGLAVEGAAFMVESEKMEDALRCYETDKYEVVRCDIGMKDDKSLAKGLTFRFVV